VPRLTAGTESSVSFSPLQDLDGIITPNGLFFERHDARRPDVDPDQHRLMIHGLVERPLILTMKDIVRFPQVPRIHFIERPANGGMEWRAAPLNSLQFTHGMIGCAEWTGVRLSLLVERGAAVFADQCAACHGTFGEGEGRYPKLAGGTATLRVAARSRPSAAIGRLRQPCSTTSTAPWRFPRRAHCQPMPFML
jgi:DMSO/TMAO reductase YedYZ molybdopterin-dependent catalytic subunit